VRVLFAIQYYPPEITAGAMRGHAFAAGLVKLGHEVSVIAEVPNHPAGVVAPGYGGRLVQRETHDGVDVSYVWVRATPGKGLAARLSNYASFAATATAAGLAAKRPDVILASSPPPTVGSVGATLAIRHRVPWVLDVRDLWPDAAVALGQVEEGLMVRATRRLERRLYASAAAIATTTRPFADAIEARGGSDKVTVIPNGTTKTFLAAGESDPRPELLDAGDAFAWTYAGNLGLVAGLETAIEAARLLGDGFRLTLVGDGQRRERLRELAASLPEGTVRFIDPVPPEEAAALLRGSDALLVCRAPNPSLDAMVLAKLYDCCAVGRPVVVAAAGETARLAREADAACCVPPGAPGALAAAIRALRDDEALRRRLASSARVFAEANTRERGVEQLERILAAATGAR
jgi:glycosyltransferase involved in cell wall biosynthesis